MRYGISLTPTVSIGVDVMGIGVALVSVMGLLGVSRGCTKLMNLVGYTIIGFVSGSNWINDALEKSWDKAYRMDRTLIRDLQIELTGVFLLSILFKYLAVINQEETENESYVKADEESPYFKSEKQLEYEISRVPLLSSDDDDLPHYSMCDYSDEYNGNGELNEGYEHGYQTLPEYTEDEYEPQVYIA
ncbi:hypothetical protein FBU30_009906 [Linnemannia zychae]|nr:hypothetical protein FBU30_009906 [Linnemannia zychae]